MGKSRTILKYDWQGRETLVDGYTDSDLAGCVRTAKSTSGGILMIGTHMIKAWSNTQNSISLSSAEAELIAMVKLSTELLGLMNLARDLNCRLHAACGQILVQPLLSSRDRGQANCDTST